MVDHHRRFIVIMIILMLVFALLFIMSLSAVNRKVALFGLGIPVIIEDYLVMFFSILGIVKAVIELYKVEHTKKAKSI
jgi:hypothetical protein